MANSNPMQWLRLILQIPSLQVLRTGNVKCPRLILAEPIQSNVRELIMLRSFLDEHSIINLFGNLRLEGFMFEDFTGLVRNTSGTVESLRMRSRSTLKFFEILSRSFPLNKEKRPQSGQIGATPSVTDFPNLETFVCDV